jgi:hypothetical protein
VPKHPKSAARQSKWYYKHHEAAKATHRAYYKKRAEKQRVRVLEKKYNLTPDAYDQMLAEQFNRCAICSKKFESRKETRIDHCHTTNKVRGILCHGCNVGLGYFYDDAEKLILAAKYLDKSRANS